MSNNEEPVPNEPPQRLPPQPYPGQVYPPQPYPPQAGQPYPPQAGQPYPPQAGQPYPPRAGQPYPGQPPYGQPPQGYGQQPPAQKRSRLPLVIGGVVGLAILALVVTFALRGNPVSPISAPLPGQTTAGQAPAATAEAAVLGYLEALARGDAATALSYAATPPADALMLTDEVLAANNATNPITAIQVSPGSTSTNTYARVEATYRLGDTAASTTFDVMQQNGRWALEEVAAKASLYDLDTFEIPVRLNGTTIPTSEVDLFPGSYQLSSGDPRYTFAADPIVIEGPAESVRPGAPTISLTKKGVAAVRSAAQAHLKACLKKRDIAPSGCGFAARAPSGVKINKSTIRWTARNPNALKTMQVKLDPADPRAATSKVTVRVHGTARSTGGTQYTVDSSLVEVYASIGEKLEVTFY